MKICVKCNKKYPNSQLFCNECGSSLQTKEEKPWGIPEIRQIEIEKNEIKKSEIEEDRTEKASQWFVSTEAEKAKQKKKKGHSVLTVIAVVLACCFLATSIVFYCKYQDYKSDYRYYSHQVDYATAEQRKTEEDLENATTRLKAAESNLEEARENLETFRSRFSDFLKHYATGTANFYPEQYILVIEQGELYSLPIYCRLSNTVWCNSGSGNHISCEWSHEWISNKTEIYISGYDEGIYKIHFYAEEEPDEFYVLVIVE